MSEKDDKKKITTFTSTCEVNIQNTQNLRILMDENLERHGLPKTQQTQRQEE